VTNPRLSPSEFLTTLREGRDALDELVPVVYDELRVIAHRHLSFRDPRGTLQTTGLVHEAYLKLVDQSRAQWNDRAHFFALASRAMRQVLIDRAKARLRQKRGGGATRVSLDVEHIPADDQPEALLQLDEALEKLSEVEPRLARVVECRFFAGLTEDETAEGLGVTPRTMQRDWAKARVLLRRALEE
jgi:RNA polymerase sigma factor (TIGR02999 family)